MEKFKAFFNFDDIGGKIKNTAKWSCWISIIVVWIASVITFFSCLSDDDTAVFSWVAILTAIVYPFLIWIGSWTIYAFGELIERAVSIDEKMNGKKTNVIEIEPSMETKPSTETSEETKPITETSKITETECIISDEGKIICPLCGFAQDSNRKCCWKCGVKFDIKNESITNATNNKQAFACPKCNNPVYYGDPVCIICGQKFDWTNM